MRILLTRTMKAGYRQGIRPRRSMRWSGLEGLEGRVLLATVAVNASQVIRSIDTQLLGVNVAWYDSNLNTSRDAADGRRQPGSRCFGSPAARAPTIFTSTRPRPTTVRGPTRRMASFIASVNGVGLATLDYGSGSPQEAAAFLAYLDGSPSNTTPIGNGQEWNDSTNRWQTVNWQTAGYWASLRAAAPLATDDGLNFLRLDHPAPFNVQYWEVGNEEYGSWEIDHHTRPARPGNLYCVCQAIRDVRRPDRAGHLDRARRGSPGSDFNNWIGQHSAAVGRPGIHAGVPERS